MAIDVTELVKWELELRGDVDIAAKRRELEKMVRQAKAPSAMTMTELLTRRMESAKAVDTANEDLKAAWGASDVVTRKWESVAAADVVLALLRRHLDFTVELEARLKVNLERNDDLHYLWRTGGCSTAAMVADQHARLNERIARAVN